MAIQSTGGSEAAETMGAASVTSGEEVKSLATTGAETSEGTQQGPAGEERPAWFPEGVNTHAEFRAWYDKEHPAALDTKDALGADAKAVETKDTTKEAAPARTVDEIKASLKEAGGFYADPRYEAAAIEFETTGTVAAETIKATAAAFGVPEDMAKTFVDTQAKLRELTATTVDTQVAQEVSTIHTVVGGPEEYAKFSKWAGTEAAPGGLSRDQIVAYNTALDKGDYGIAKALVEGFTASYKAAGNGAPPRDITQQGSREGDGTATIAGYASSAEMQKAMNDPRYRRDAAYTREVELKTGASKF